MFPRDDRSYELDAFIVAVLGQDALAAYDNLTTITRYGFHVRDGCTRSLVSVGQAVVKLGWYVSHVDANLGEFVKGGQIDPSPIYVFDAEDVDIIHYYEPENLDGQRLCGG